MEMNKNYLNYRMEGNYDWAQYNTRQHLLNGNTVNDIIEKY